MTLRSSMRNLAFTGMVVGALNGCASTQATAPPARPAAPQAAAPQRAETPTERCVRENRTRVQNCIIETIVTGCRESSQGNEDDFYTCVSDGLLVPHPMPPGPATQFSVTVSAGDEVLSIRVGGPVAMDAARLEVSQIDGRGVAFLYEAERLATAAPTERTRVESTTVRFNFDGTSEGEMFRLQGLPVWNLRVQASGSGQAQVSFETNDPTVLVRGSAAPAPAIVSEGGEQKKK